MMISVMVRRFTYRWPRVHEYLKEISEAVFKNTVAWWPSVRCLQPRWNIVSNTQTLITASYQWCLTSTTLRLITNGEKKVDQCTIWFSYSSSRSVFNHWQTGLNGKGWERYFWCNHDQPRVVSRLGNVNNIALNQPKMLAASVHMMQGTPYLSRWRDWHDQPGLHRD